jgi:hypothetical protein
VKNINKNFKDPKLSLVFEVRVAELLLLLGTETLSLALKLLELLLILVL